MDWQEKLTKDNLNATWLAHELGEIKGILVNPAEVETNILRFRFEPSLMKKMRCDYHQFVARLREEESILANSGFANDYVRFVTHRDVSREQCE